MAAGVYIDITLKDLVRLLGAYLSTVEAGLGELGAEMSVDNIYRRIDTRSIIRIELEEMESILYHAQQAVLEKEPAGRDLIRDFNHFKEISERVAELNKDLMCKNWITGEYRVRNFTQE